jgi:glycosyltransferase involved in cell wall biosynthesis
MEVEADLVVASSAGFAHGVRAAGPVVVYCHTPARWLYQPSERYLGQNPLGRAVMRAAQQPLTRWDREAASAATRYIVNSTAVAARVRATYGIESEVIHPPVTLDPSRPTHRPHGFVEDSRFLLCVARLVPYKNVTAVVDAFRVSPDLRLVVVGKGPLRRTLAKTKPPNVELITSVTDAELCWLYHRCDGLIAASYEDFGITPLEAFSFSKPVAALRWGGYLDTVAEGSTGLFFDAPESEAIAETVRALLAHSWDVDRLRQQATRFAEPAFIDRVRGVVNETFHSTRRGDRPPDTGTTFA